LGCLGAVKWEFLIGKIISGPKKDWPFLFWTFLTFLNWPKFFTNFCKSHRRIAEAVGFRGNGGKFRYFRGSEKLSGKRFAASGKIG